MKKLAPLAFALAIIMAVAGCSSGSSSVSKEASSSQNTAQKTVESSGLQISVPSSWEEKPASDGVYVYPDFGGLLYLVTEASNEYDGSSLEDYCAGVIRGMESDGSMAVAPEITNMNVGKAAAFRADASATVEGKAYAGQIEIIVSGGRCYIVTFIVPEADYPQRKGDITATLDTLHALNSQAPIQAKQAESGTQQESPSITVSQRNAVEKAKDYLKYSAFSHDGLVAQLEYEKFNHDDAVYGADNCGADWNEQAAKKAASYLEYSSFSRDGLIEQLLYDEFTQEQAEYGVASVRL